MTALILVSLVASLTSADLALEAGDYPAAAQYYREVLEDDPDSFPARYGLARTLAFARHWGEALDLFTDLLVDEPANGDIRLARGRLLAWMERYPEAEKDLTFVVEQTPEYADAWSALGDVFMWTDRPELAIDAYTRWAELDPANPDPYLSRARANREARLFTQARYDLERAEGRGANPGTILRERTAIEQAPILGDWEVGGYYDFLGYLGDRANWHTAWVSAKRQLDLASVALDVTIAARFEKVDQAIGLESYVHLWRGAYCNLRAQLAPKAEVLPTWDLRAALYQAFAKIWEVGAHYRFMDFPNNSVHIFGASIGVSIGNWFVMQQTSIVPDEGEIGFNLSALVRFYYDTVDDIVELRGGAGRQVVLLAPSRVQTRPGWFFTLRATRFFTKHFGVQLSFTTEQDQDVPLGLGAGTGLVGRW